MSVASGIHLTFENKKALKDWLGVCPQKQKQRGYALAANRHVLLIATEDSAENLHGVVLGSDHRTNYTVHLTFRPTGALAECTCPYLGFCKHAAALVKVLIDEAPETSAPQMVQKPTDPTKKEMPTLADEVSLKLGKKLPPQAVLFLKCAARWQRTGNNKIPETEFVKALENRSIWDHSSKVEIHPVEMPPRDIWDFLAFLQIAAIKKKTSLPRPIPDAIDRSLLEELTTKVNALCEIHEWNNDLARWKPSQILRTPRHVELKLQLGQTDLQILAREGDSADFTPAKLKLLRECDSDTRYQNKDSTLLDAGSAAVLRAVQNPYGAINTVEISRFSPSLHLCLSQLVRNPDLLRSHVIDADGNPVSISETPLVWRIDPPGKTDSTHYTLDLIDSEGRSASPAHVILHGEPLFYVSERGIHPLERWPFGERSRSFPLKIPVPSMEKPDGLAAVADLAVSLPTNLESRIRRLPLQVKVDLRYAQIGPPELRIKASASTENDTHLFFWEDNGWLDSGQSPHKNKSQESIVTLVDKFSLAPASEWLRSVPFKATDNYATVDGQAHRLPAKAWPEIFLAWIATRPDSIALRLDKELASLREGAIAGHVSIDIAESADIDWFDLSVALKVDDTTLSQEEIDLLLKARGQWVRLDGKGWRKLDFDMTDEQIEELADLGLAPRDFSAEKQRLHALQLGSLARKKSKLLETSRVEQICRRIGEIQTRATPPAPVAITATLRPYQLDGFHFLAYLTANRFGGVLADDMGLGKTLQSLCWLAWLRDTKQTEGPALVVCPKSVQDNWRAEAARFLPGLRVQVWNRDNVGKTGLDGSIELLVIHYAQLRTQEEKLHAVRWGAVILDEAQNIKNPTSQNARAACALHSAHRLALTGTPIENRLLDLWSIFQFAMPGVLGHRAGFLKNFDRKDDIFARRRLAARTRPFLLRRTKSEVASDLPERIEEDIIVEMEGIQAKLYKAEIKRARAQLLKAATDKQLDKLRFNILTSLLRLRQICCHPRLLGLDEKPKEKKADHSAPTEDSAKLSALLDLLEPLMEEGQKVVVFSQFLEMLGLAGEALAAREWKTFRLDGSTEDRGTLVQEFQNHDGPAVFLISLKAGGSGLNLTSAAYVVLFDPWWNPAVEAQAIDRTHRIGQKQTVFAYRLLVKDSIEEKIRRLQKQKGALAKDILGEENFARALTLEDFQFLLGDE